MILSMCRKLIAVLLIFGWISLSGFDLVEDFDEIPGQVAVSSSAPDNSSSSKRGGWGPLANNVVEFANHTRETDVAFISFTPSAFEFDPVFDFPRYFRWHKLYRVFLI